MNNIQYNNFCARATLYPNVTIKEVWEELKKYDDWPEINPLYVAEILEYRKGKLAGKLVQEKYIKPIN